MNNIMIKPKYCSICGEKLPLKLHSIGHVYTLDPRDWIYSCERCHCLLDSLIDCRINGINKTILDKSTMSRLFKTPIF